MNKPQTVKLDRYPGLRPFIREDGLIFFGRNMEAEMLLQSIKVNMNFILFSKSGLGKSSLINAGVMPKLIEEGFCPIVIRFYNTITDPLPAITSEIVKHLPDGTLASIPAADRSSLLVLLDHWTKKERVLLIFDQFEEFFYHNISNRDAAITQLAAIANRNWQAERRSPVHLLFLIRSDRLNLMNEVAEKIPGIFSNRYELKPLLKEKAEQAIVLPSQIRDRDNRSAFKYPTFDYSLPAIKIILDTLSNKQGEIESSQLQIVCQEMEEIAGLKSARAKSKAPVDIEPEDFKGEAGIREILNKFYSKQLEKLSADKHLGLKRKDIDTIRVIIENELVSGNKRVIQSESRIRELVEKVRPGVTHIANKEKIDAVIDKLLDLRLIREEESHLGKVYEISHDTLLESIIKSRDQRRSNEQKRTIQQQAAQLAEEKRRAEDERKLKDKARLERKAAIAAQQVAQEAQLKASKNLRLASISLALAAVLGIGMVFLIFSLRKQRNLSYVQKERYKNVYGQMLAINAGRAYEDRNHALAFNLAQYADSLLKRGDKLLDSLLKTWSLEEYSGNVQVSSDNVTMACQYRNGSLQIFNMAQLTRSRNKYLLLPGVTSYLLSREGDMLAVSDTAGNRVRIYQLLGKDKLDTVLLRTIKNCPKNPTFTGVNKKYMVIKAEDSSMLIYRLRDTLVKKVANPHAESLELTFINDDTAIFYQTSPRTMSTLDLRHAKVINNGWDLLIDYSRTAHPCVYDRKRRTVLRIDGRTITPIVAFRDLSSSLAMTGFLQTEDRYVMEFYESSGNRIKYLFVNRDRGSPDDLIRIAPNAHFYDHLGRIVQFTSDKIMFIGGNQLSTVDLAGSIHQDTLLNAPKENPASAPAFSNYFLSSKGTDIYGSIYPDRILYRIALNDRPEFSIAMANSDYWGKLLRFDLFSTGDGFISADTAKKDRAYWRNFYEPLSQFDKKTYSITE